MKSLLEIAGDLAQGRTSSRKLVEESLSTITAKSEVGFPVFLNVDAEGARLAADYQDNLRKRGFAPSPFAGIPFSVKDLFDIAGQVTAAGSKVLKNAAPATADAPAIAALKSAGLVVLGRTNMTEFAYSGLGLNPHFGTPKSIFDKKVGRIPGGSSAGAAVAVAEGMCALSIGSDTGGSCRIPAAYNGIVGYKPSTGRITTKGAFPLSSTLDSIGPLGNTVACCAVADALMAGDWDGKLGAGPSRRLRIGILQTTAIDGLDAEVAEDFNRKIAELRAKGVEVEAFHFEPLTTLPSLLKRGGIVGVEANAVHRDRLETHAAEYDPRVSGRIQLAAATTGADYIEIQQKRSEMIAAYREASRGFDAIALPTVANIPPPIFQAESDENYFKLNGLALRNTYIANFINLCAINLPMNKPDFAPTGFSLMAAHGADVSLFNIANSIA
jgi:aspartyl-tRNA(Asn)/glutamyl-tRNA(Gln) amidotransferase subunit A